MPPNVFSIYILPISQILVFIASIVLLGITWRYLIYTKKMVNLMVKDFEIRTKPIVEIKDLSSFGDPLYYNLRVEINNAGSYMVELLGYGISYSHLFFREDGHQTTDINYQKAIFPGESIQIERKYSLGAITTLLDLIKDREDNPIDVDGRLKFRDILGNTFYKSISGYHTFGPITERIEPVMGDPRHDWWEGEEPYG